MTLFKGLFKARANHETSFMAELRSDGLLVSVSDLEHEGVRALAGARCVLRQST